MGTRNLSPGCVDYVSCPLDCLFVLLGRDHAACDDKQVIRVLIFAVLAALGRKLEQAVKDRCGFGAKVRVSRAGFLGILDRGFAGFQGGDRRRVFSGGIGGSGLCDDENSGDDEQSR